MQRSFWGLSKTKLASLLVVIALIALGSLTSGHVFAAMPAQATAVVTVAAPVTASTPAATVAAPAPVSTTAATVAAPAAATMAATTASTPYPPCPSLSTEPAVIQSTAAATVAAPSVATMAATVAAINPNPGYLGIRAEEVPDCGSMIVEVLPNSAAAQAGLQANDVIVGLNGAPSNDITVLRQNIQALVPGAKVTLTIERSGSQLDVVVTLGTKPADTTPVPSAGTSAATMAATQ